MQPRVVFNHPEFKHIPATEYWRMFIDGEQQINPAELGWWKYETREKGCVKNLFHAYAYMLDTLNTPMNHEYFQKIHSMCMRGVSTNMGGGLVAGKYRQDDNPAMIMQLGKNASEKGFAFLRSKGSKITLVSDAIYAASTLGRDIESQVDAALKKYNDNLTKIKSDVKMEGNPHELNKTKLMNIIEFIQTIEHLHPFLDGNGRTFCTIILNKVLLENGFRPVILENPNRFDGFAPDELIQEIEKGFDNFANIKKLKPSTTEILESQLAIDSSDAIFLPIHWAATLNSPEIMAAMIKVSDKKVNAIEPGGNTPLIIAAYYGNLEVVQELLKTGKVAINHKGQFGNTALMWAAEMGHQHIVELLLKHGAHSNIKSQLGLTLDNIQNKKLVLKKDDSVHHVRMFQPAGTENTLIQIMQHMFSFNFSLEPLSKAESILFGTFDVYLRTNINCKNVNIFDLIILNYYLDKMSSIKPFSISQQLMFDHIQKSIQEFNVADVSGAPDTSQMDHLEHDLDRSLKNIKNAEQIYKLLFRNKFQIFFNSDYGLLGMDFPITLAEKALDFHHLKAIAEKSDERTEAKQTLFERLLDNPAIRKRILAFSEPDKKTLLKLYPQSKEKLNALYAVAKNDAPGLFAKMKALFYSPPSLKFEVKTVEKKEGPNTNRRQ